MEEDEVAPHGEELGVKIARNHGEQECASEVGDPGATLGRESSGPDKISRQMLVCRGVEVHRHSIKAAKYRSLSILCLVPLDSSSDCSSMPRLHERGDRKDESRECCCRFQRCVRLQEFKCLVRVWRA